MKLLFQGSPTSRGESSSRLWKMDSEFVHKIFKKLFHLYKEGFMMILIDDHLGINS